MAPDIETGAPGTAGSAAADRWLAALCMDRWRPAEAKRQGNPGREAKPVAWVRDAAGHQKLQRGRHRSIRDGKDFKYIACLCLLRPP